MAFLKLFLVTLLFVALALAGMAVKVIFQKGGKMKSSSVGKNKKMKELGINCAKTEEIKCRKQIKDNTICEACSDF